MTKNRFETSGKGPIARKVIAAISNLKNSKIVNLAAYKQAQMNVEEMQKTVVSRDDLAGYDPAHAIYIYVQNVVSVLVENLTALTELSKISDIVEAAQEEYQPSGPPWSPLTTSYFTCWCFFDLAIGLRKESLGSISIEVGHELGMHPEFIKLARIMQQSRMGIYQYQGLSDGFFMLKEFVTETSHRCIVPSGYVGRPGEIWLVRILPPPQESFNYSVVFTTPYVIIRPEKEEWQAYFDRTLKGVKQTKEGYERLLKYGPERHYWNEYIFEAYVNHVSEAIFLAGLPDVASSRPHSPEYIGSPR